jgi:trimeric autotransporter adhesin
MRLSVPLFLLMLVSAGSAHATTVCVDTVPELVAAINSFDIQPDHTTLVIKVVQGTYVVNAQLGAVEVHSAYPNSVGFELRGGYTANCAGRVLNPGNTFIDGNNQLNGGLAITMDDDANALVEGLTFTHFNNSSFGVLSLAIDVGTSDESRYSVRQCRFINNVGKNVISLSAPEMHVVNTLVANNALSGSGAAAIFAQYSYAADSGLSLTNSTVANNSGGAGVNVDTGGYQSARFAEISNNILWGNGGADLRLLDFNSAQNTLLVNGNVIGSSVGSLPAGNNISTNPLFINAAAGNFGLSVSSAAINSGFGLQVYGFPPVDLAGNSRIVGSRIDRGAYESSVDDNTNYVVTNTGDNGNNSTPLTGSLRAAIKAANAASGPFKINFSINGPCPQIINMSTPMLDVTSPATIDARTQSGWTGNTSYGRFNANLCVVLNGSGATPYAFHVPSNASSASLAVHGFMFAGFNDAAIKIEGGSNHRISGNQFGAVPFTTSNQSAIRVSANSGGAIIGGFDDTTAVNLIAGGTGPGVYIDNAAGGSALGNNVIGYQPDGLGSGPNYLGVYIFNSPANTLLYNYIGQNAVGGVTLSGSNASGTLLQYNQIGADWTGARPGNQGPGILINFGAQNTTVGSPFTGNFGVNQIASSTGPGVWIATSAGAGNRVLSNQFVNNQGLDIDLASSGPSSNQGSNPAIGPNHLQNYPQLATALRSTDSNATLTINGALRSTPNSSFRIDFYAATACSSAAPGRGVARVYLGRSTVSTNASGDTNFTGVVTATGDSSYSAISATATSISGDTSEIGNCVIATTGNLPPVLFANGFE